MNTQTADIAFPKLIETLNRCIEANIDAEKGYAIAGADVVDPSLKTLLLGYSAQRATFVGALQTAIQDLGSVAENRGTLQGIAHRGFLGARIALEGRGDAVILGECERGDTGALAVYDDVFAQAPLDKLPTGLRLLLTEQRAAITGALQAITAQDLQRRQSTMPEPTTKPS